MGTNGNTCAYGATATHHTALVLCALRLLMLQARDIALPCICSRSCT